MQDLPQCQQQLKNNYLNLFQCCELIMTLYDCLNEKNYKESKRNNHTEITLPIGNNINYYQFHINQYQNITKPCIIGQLTIAATQLHS